MTNFRSKYKALSFLLFLCASHVSHAQQALDTLIKKFDRYRIQNVQEKIFIHTSHDFFLTGETMWFKIYCTDGTLHYPLGQSSIAYVEILNKENQPVLQTKVALKNSEGEGSCFLPASLISGNYKLRAYTRWMRNYNADFYFEKDITIVNPFRKIEREKLPGSGSYAAAFFPEGGQLVHGIASRVAFKITDGYGKGTNLEGAVLNSRKDTIASIKPFKFGMGTFSITPDINEQYVAILKDPSGKIITSHFPEIQPSGYVLNLDQTDAQTVSVTVKTNIAATTSQQIILLVHARQIVVKAEIKSVQQDETNFSIKKSELPEGISHFTIFNSELVPLCERLYFKKPSTVLSTRISTDEHQYQKRKKVSLKLNTTCNDALVSASLSISVNRIDSLQVDQQPGILEYLYLSSDLAGAIESPQYYFSNDPLAETAADNLMLTHGWSRFKWEEVVNMPSMIKFMPELKGHIIIASVSNNTDKKNDGILTFLSVPGKNANLYGSVSKDNGSAKFEINNFYGSRRLVLQTDLTKDSVYKISIDDPFSPEKSKSLHKKFVLTPSVRDDLAERSLAMQVQDIFAQEIFSSAELTENDTLPFFGHGDDTYYLDEYTRFPVMEEVMREYVPGVLVRKRKDGFYFIVLDNVRKTVFRENPLILLDGIPLFDTDHIMTFDPRKVKRLDVINRRYYLGPLMFHGIVSYATYNGDLGGFELDPRAVSIDYEGLQQHQEFYHPSYENHEQRNSRIPDKRHLLYWNPNVKTESEGTTQIQFYTSDVPGTYKIVTEGITKKGCPGSAMHLITVK